MARNNVSREPRHLFITASASHQSLANKFISPEPWHLANTGDVQRRQRLGGMLNYYYRTAA